ncbi:MAG: hypothetical protein QMD92_05200 [bacterium]|nr:hypothetical protein [bacterium]
MRKIKNKKELGFTIIEVIMIVAAIIVAYFIIKSIAQESGKDIDKNIDYIILESKAEKIKKAITKDVEKTYELFKDHTCLVECVTKRNAFKEIRLPLMLADRNKNTRDGGELLYILKKEKEMILVLYGVINKDNLMRFKFIYDGHKFVFKEGKLITKNVVYIHFNGGKNSKVIAIKGRLGKGKVRYDFSFSAKMFTTERGVRRAWDY